MPSKDARRTRRWVRLFSDLYQPGGPIDDIVRSCRQNVGGLSVECRSDVGQASDGVVPPAVSMPDRCMFIGMVCYVWHRMYEDWDKSSDPDVCLNVHWYDIDHAVGMPGLCKAMAKHGWLKIDGKTLVGIDLRKHFGMIVEDNAREAYGAQVRRNPVGEMSDGCRRDVGSVSGQEKKRRDKSSRPPIGPPQAGDGDGAKRPPKLLPPYTEAFDRFWARYPRVRRLNKTGAFKVWVKDAIERPAEPGKKPLLEFVMESLEKWIKCDSWQKGYVCAPTVWLNQKRWSNDPPTEEKPE